MHFFFISIHSNKSNQITFKSLSNHFNHLMQQEHVSKDALKSKNGKSKSGLQHMQHTAAELKKKSDDTKPVKSEMEQQYEKVMSIAQAKKKQEQGEEEDKDESDLSMIKHVEKVAMKKANQKHRVKTSDRMLADMKQILMQLNGGTLEGADRYNMRRFVSNVFNRYRFNHEREEERKRHIIALREHMNKEHDQITHRPNFMDEFYEPRRNGFDPYNYANTKEVGRNMRIHPSYPAQYLQANGIPQYVAEPPTTRLSRLAKTKIVGDGDVYYNSPSPALNMPLVAPPAIQLNATATSEEVPKGIFPKAWYYVRNALF